MKAELKDPGDTTRKRVTRALKGGPLYRKLRTRVREIINRAALDDPCLPAKFYPIEREAASYIIPAESASESASDLPCPPQHLWWGYAKSADVYLSKGRAYVEAMKRILQESNSPLKPGSRILDFGCGSGIMLRWLRDIAESGEAWGVDISGLHMLWCQDKLSPPFKFATTTSFPHLPFEDNYFDLVYAGSVFTHIADLIEFWLLELRRIVRPGGRLYLTVSDESTIEQLQATPEQNQGLRSCLQEFDQKTHALKSNFGLMAVHRRPGEGSSGQAQVFYRRDFLRKHWGAFLSVISMTQNAYGFQTAVLLEKRRSAT